MKKILKHLEFLYKILSALMLIVAVISSLMNSEGFSNLFIVWTLYSVIYIYIKGKYEN